MAYTPGATSLNNGNQQVNIHPYQELTSLNANKLLLGLFEPGVYNSKISITQNSNNVFFTIKQGTTFIFNKSFSGTDLVAKITLQDDAVITATKSVLSTYTTQTALILIASWEYNVADAANIYATFRLFPYEQAYLTDIDTYNDVVIGIILNQAEFISNGNNATYYRVSYQQEKYRDSMKKFYEITSGFPITFDHNGVGITVGEGNCIIGDTYIHNKNTITASLANLNWPSPISTGTPNNFMQIDVLRLKTERDNSGSNVPYLAWESFLKNKPFTNIKEFIDGFDFTWRDIGYTLMFVVRDRNNLLSTSKIWPEHCLIVNPLLPQIGQPETLTRFKLPIY